MKKSLTKFFGFLLTMGISFPLLNYPSQAQIAVQKSPEILTQITEEIQQLIDLNRAKNLARQAAEKANGGLSVYRTEDSLHGEASKAPFVDNGESWTFTIRGRRPDSSIFTLETVVTVSKDGKTVTVDYNGPLRSSN